MADIFAPVVESDRLHPSIRDMLAQSPSPAREAMQLAYSLLPSPDANFIRGFQTTGFDARVWELYLASYFNDVCDQVEQPYEQPDFLLHVASGSVWVEATTANPTQGGTATAALENHWDYHKKVAIKLGSALWSNVSKRYWERPHVSGHPLVLAVADFHEANPARSSASPLMEYLYGLHASPTASGYEESPIEQVSLGDKVIPAPFFDQPDTENVSAVLFSNAGTHAKFSRMGFNPGVHKTLRMIRRGFCFASNQVLPDPFAYVVGNAPEKWGQEVHVFHNPKALIPLPDTFFTEAVHCRMTDRQHLSFQSGDFVPLGSHTILFHIGDRDPNAFEEVLREGCRKWVLQVQALEPEFASKLRDMHREWEP